MISFDYNYCCKKNCQVWNETVFHCRHDREAKITFCILKQYKLKTTGIPHRASPSINFAEKCSPWNPYTRGKYVGYDYYDEINKCFTEKQCPPPIWPQREWVGIFFFLHALPVDSLRFSISTSIFTVWNLCLSCV